MNKEAEGDERLAKERAFHDAWADSEGIENIDIHASNESCTAPEMRYITQRLGDIQGKRLLDVGCGLGEASVLDIVMGITSGPMMVVMLAGSLTVTSMGQMVDTWVN